MLTDARLVKIGDVIRREPGGDLWTVTGRHRAGDTILLTIVTGDQTVKQAYSAHDQLIVVE